MRLRVAALPVLVILAAPALLALRTDGRPAPKQANITAACTPGGNPGVNPPSIAMRRADHIVWGSVSPKAVAWTITPKDTLDWPFAAMSFTGTPTAPAVTPQPLPGAVLHHAYGYNVTVVCADGTSQLIDPDIIIGE